VYRYLSLCIWHVTGGDVVDWLYSRVEGFKDRRDARKYASGLLKHGYLRHTVNKITFSEQCYYTFGDLCQSTTTSLHFLHAFYLSSQTECFHLFIISAFVLRHGCTKLE